MDPKEGPMVYQNNIFKDPDTIAELPGESDELSEFLPVHDQAELFLPNKNDFEKAESNFENQNKIISIPPFQDFLSFDPIQMNEFVPEQINEEQIEGLEVPMPDSNMTFNNSPQKIKKRVKKSEVKQVNELNYQAPLVKRTSSKRKDKIKLKLKSLKKSHDFKAELKLMLNDSLKMSKDLRKRNREKKSLLKKILGDQKSMNVRNPNAKSVKKSLKPIMSNPEEEKQNSQDNADDLLSKLDFYNNIKTVRGCSKQQLTAVDSISPDHRKVMEEVKDMQTYNLIKSGKILKVEKIKFDPHKQIYALIEWSPGPEAPSVEQKKVDLNIVKLIDPLMVCNFLIGKILPKDN